MSAPALLVEGLGKRYSIGGPREAETTFYGVLSGLLSAPLARLNPSRWKSGDREDFWALQDVSFRIDPGEVVGIVGRNGAGKSTLLKIISRITAPSTGRVTYRGRLASLLEVGTGFHPELTGRENIRLNAAILGMRSHEIARKFDDIVQFSGVERFIDTPVKRYSSGMYVRLAFAVAAHVDADILLVDEVLAVGDAEFQKRCLGKMGEVAHAGRAVVFVSHNLTALRNLCTTGLLLNGGRMQSHGGIDAVLNSYASQRASLSENAVDLDDTSAVEIAAIRRVEVTAGTGGRDKEVSVSSGAVVKILVEVARDQAEVAAFLHCHDESQNRVFSSGSFFRPELNGLRLGKGLHEFECPIPGHLLNAGEYSLDVMLVLNRKEVIAEESALLWFRVQDEPLGIAGWHWPPIGTIRPQLDWRHRRQ